MPTLCRAQAEGEVSRYSKQICLIIYHSMNVIFGRHLSTPQANQAQGKRHSKL